MKGLEYKQTYFILVIINFHLRKEEKPPSYFQLKLLCQAPASRLNNKWPWKIKFIIFFLRSSFGAFRILHAVWKHAVVEL